MSQLVANGQGTYMTRPVLESVGGAVALDSKFYIRRPVDEEFLEALDRRDSVVLLKGARQVGKTSLLARGLARARQKGATVILTDFQKLNSEDLVSAEAFFRTMARGLVDRLDLDIEVDAIWDSRLSPGVMFERFFLNEVMRRFRGHVVWAMDEVDRLFTSDFAGDVFGLFRAWHNERALDPEGHFPRLTLAIAHATEAYLFITDKNLSPFNVGTRLLLEDFSLEEVAELNRLYGSPLKVPAELERFYSLVGGQPFLVRRSLHELVISPSSLAQFADKASLDEGIFGDHLRRIIILLGHNRILLDAVRQILTGQPCLNWDSVHRLRSAGVLAAATANEPARPRCQLYASYLVRHLA